MAKTVAEIDGDSSGLVSELGKAKGAMGDLGAQGKKLSDQLKSVADDADIAAGNLVNKLGGPSAIKAIAGVGLAFEGASRLAGAFLDSSEALFRSYGDEGQKVWDNAEKSLFAIKGAFAEAVLGGGDMNDMGARLKSMFEGMKTAVDLLLTPVKALSNLVIALGGDLQTTAGYAVEASDKLDQLASSNRLTGLTKTAEGIEGLRIKLMGLRGETENLRQVELARDIASAEALKNDILATELQSDAISSAAAVAGAQGDIAKKADAARLKYLKDLGEEKYTQGDLAAARRVYNDEMLRGGQAVMAQQMEQRKGVSAANQAQLDELDGQIASFKKLAETKPVVATGGGPQKPVDDTVYAVQQAEGGYAKLTKIQYDALDKMQQQTGDYSQRIMEMTQAEFDGMAAIGDSAYLAEIAMQTKRDEADAERRAAKAAAIKKEEELVAQGKLDLMMEEMEAIQKAKEKEIADDKAAKALMFNLAVTQNGKMLANAIVGNKKMGEVARAALGNVASGLGDIAMVKSAEYAAEGLWPQASAMAVAGTLGYTIASALGADKKANAGPPTERQQPVQNYAYNLRIDSTFADSESISRRFAQMQEGARQRGLITGMA